MTGPGPGGRRGPGRDGGAAARRRLHPAPGRDGVLLILLGGALLRISLTDVHLRYVKAAMAPYLVASGFLLLALGLAGVVADLRRRSGPHPPAHEPRVGWLLLLPVLGIFLIAPPALGSYAAARDDAAPVAAEPAQRPAFSPLPDPAPGAAGVPLTLTEYFTRAVWDDGATLDRPVELTGFVTPRPAGGFYLTRLQIACCAADAQALKVVVHADGPVPAADTWLSVVGRYAPAEPHPTEGYEEAVLTADTLTEIPAPENPYEL